MFANILAHVDQVGHVSQEFLKKICNVLVLGNISSVERCKCATIWMMPRLARQLLPRPATGWQSKHLSGFLLHVSMKTIVSYPSNSSLNTAVRYSKKKNSIPLVFRITKHSKLKSKVARHIGHWSQSETFKMSMIDLLSKNAHTLAAET